MPPPPRQPDRERNKTELADEIAMAVTALRSQGIVRSNDMASVLAASQIIVKTERLRELFEESVGHPVAWKELASIYEETWGIVDRAGRARVKEVFNRGPMNPDAPTPSETSPAPSNREPGGRVPKDDAEISLDGIGL